MALPIELQWVLVALATWRLCHLLAHEDGPGNGVVRLRAWLGDSTLGRAMDCFYCLSLWVAAPLVLPVAHNLSSFVLLWLGSSGAACLLERATQAHPASPLEQPREQPPEGEDP